MAFCLLCESSLSQWYRRGQGPLLIDSFRYRCLNRYLRNCNKPVAGPVAPIDKKIHNASTPCLHACQLALYGLRVTTISPSGKLALELICIGFHPVRCVYSAVLARFSGLARPSSANRQCTDRHPHSTNQTPKARHTYHMTTSIMAPACIATSFTGPIQCTPITGPH